MRLVLSLADRHGVTDWRELMDLPMPVLQVWSAWNIARRIGEER